MFCQKTWRGSGTIPPGLTPPPWTSELDIEFMDRHGIDTVILSLSAPGLAFVPPAQAASLARQTNTACAAIRDGHPRRFGFFATLPLENDDVPSSLVELTHALDVLRADGVILLSSYNGRYLGDARFRPLWQALSQRRAVVFVHPTSPPAHGQLRAGGQRGAAVLPAPLIDFPHETTRCAVHLITSNIVRDFPDIKIILSHGGGTLPFVASRIAHLTAAAGLMGAKSADEFLREARSFYFDLALTGYDEPMRLVLDFAEEGHVLYGSDFPFAKERAVATQLETLQALGGEREGRWRTSVESGAALKLFPRFGDEVQG
ncbi:hypothetical protein MMYC01_203700 [Madurella mycetomatis]|uniref:6-methylsalicylate decarboxylase n=1 Tax=Madurella mycetomatis TaxID=100816 RepID=A0A175W6E7_9PEZI|nr:hypothetical protein MMYC01_203700 [Madurella mycetomatis]